MRSSDSSMLTRDQADRFVADYRPSDRQSDQSTSSPAHALKPPIFSIFPTSKGVSVTTFDSQSQSKPNAATLTTSAALNTSNSAGSSAGGLFANLNLVPSTTASVPVTSSGGGLFASLNLVPSTTASFPVTSSGGGLFAGLSLVPSTSASAQSLFSNVNLTSFSSIASNSGEVKPLGFAKVEGFKWGGAGGSLFGSANSSKNGSKSATGAESGDEGSDTEQQPAEQFEPSAVFQPVLKELPPLVEAVTGEEDDRVLFSERAAIYHFSANAWRERGRGSFKLTYHRTSGRFRLLLRREQVLKLACNHVLTRELSFSLNATNKKALSWVSRDFAELQEPAEDPDKPLLISLRFKVCTRTRFKYSILYYQYSYDRIRCIVIIVFFQHEQQAARLLQCVQEVQTRLREVNGDSLPSADAEAILSRFSTASDLSIETESNN